ncbi:MAG: inverse autotransporter beta domain-containing protein [Deltaproteobacteria bacterium]|nr:inverse autotransporter beta domain-containing protein [Deltaproteobacteria bacterium]
MKSSFKIYIAFITSYVSMILTAVSVYGATASATPFKNRQFPSEVETPLIAQQFEQRKENARDQSHTERYLPYTINYGLRMALPSPLRNTLDFDAGFDKWEGLPTLKADYFMPVKAWNDKSVFFTPRVCLTGRKESYAVGAGVRHLITSDTMIGFHAFYDWTRPRRPGGEFLREAGVGVEFSALPGYFSDLTLSANAYFPVNSREEIRNNGISLMKESLPRGGDAKISLLLPPVFSWLDFRLDASAHQYIGQTSNSSGYRTALSVNSRDGMFNMNFEQGRDSRWGQNYSVTAGIQLAFDWNALINSKNPFSAPYTFSETRYNRKLRNSLFSRVKRKHDLPEDRLEQRSTLMASVMGDTVTFTGGFPRLPYSTLTVQISQSPWQDYSEVLTDDTGTYYGAISLPPGVCKVRLVHKPSGRVTEPRTIVVTEPGEPSETNSRSGE